jgi:hypothetical protein
VQHLIQRRDDNPREISAIEAGGNSQSWQPANQQLKIRPETLNLVGARFMVQDRAGDSVPPCPKHDDQRHHSDDSDEGAEWATHLAYRAPHPCCGLLRASLRHLIQHHRRREQDGKPFDECRSRQR